MISIFKGERVCLLSRLVFYSSVFVSLLSLIHEQVRYAEQDPEQLEQLGLSGQPIHFFPLFFDITI